MTKPGDGCQLPRIGDDAVAAAALGLANKREWVEVAWKIWSACNPGRGPGAFLEDARRWLKMLRYLRRRR